MMARPHVPACWKRPGGAGPGLLGPELAEPPVFPLDSAAWLTPVRWYPAALRKWAGPGLL